MKIWTRKRFWCPIAINESQSMWLVFLRHLFWNTPMRTFIISIEIWIVIQIEWAILSSISRFLFLSRFLCHTMATGSRLYLLSIIIFPRIRMWVCLFFNFFQISTSNSFAQSVTWAGHKPFTFFRRYCIYIFHDTTLVDVRTSFEYEKIDVGNEPQA